MPEVERMQKKAKKRIRISCWLWKNRQLTLGGILVVLILFTGIAAPQIAPNDPLAVDVVNKLASPCRQFPLGTDQLGRCIFSRIIWGAQASLTYSVIVLVSMLAISVPVGIVSGYFGGKLDQFLMRVIDIFMAFPSTILALAIAGILGPSKKNLLFAMICVWWTGYARLVRGMVLQLKEQSFIQAARAAGCPRWKIVFKHLGRNLLSPMLILSTMEIGSIILSIAGFSFIGLGAQPPTPEWGIMLSDSRQYLQTQPQLMVYPGIAIIITVAAFNMLGEGLQKLLGENSVL